MDAWKIPFGIEQRENHKFTRIRFFFVLEFRLQFSNRTKSPLTLFRFMPFFTNKCVFFFQLERRKWDFPAMKHVLGEGLNGKSPKTLTVDKSTETH